MNRLPPTVDDYLLVGCGRCTLGGTPDCKVLPWQSELRLLREILLASELVEEVKWGFPTYTLDGKNVVMLAAWRDGVTLSFLKGVLLNDPQGRLTAPGPNSQSARQWKFTDSDEIEAMREEIAAFVEQAIELERSGAKLPPTDPSQYELPDELASRIEQDPGLAAAYFSLTPGRQRSHIIFISGAKQSATRAARVEKCVPLILAGIGLHDR